ncbi:MAG TPA: hypothetical protein VI855_09530, partial [Dehalococcoidia bacterium]|nr:hypothetical protein [Dehalococcoidia bacterium]
LRRGELTVEGREGGRLNDESLRDRNFGPACVAACPTNALVFGDQHDPSSAIGPYFADANEHVHEKDRTTRAYRLLEEMATKPNVIYLKKVDQYPIKQGEQHG